VNARSNNLWHFLNKNVCVNVQSWWGVKSQPLIVIFLQTMSSETKWESLCSYPAEYPTNFIQLNSSQFICANYCTEDKSIRLMKYSTFKDEWKEHLTLPPEISFPITTICYDDLMLLNLMRFLYLIWIQWMLGKVVLYVHEGMTVFLWWWY